MKIICIGRNYANHAAELNNPIPEEPVIFLKPDSSLLRGNADFFYPEITSDLHYECELVYRVSKEGKFVTRNFATTYLDAVGLGIDFTARDLQQKAKDKGLPWTLAKGFHGSAPVSEFIPLDEWKNPLRLTFEFYVNGERRQSGDSANMIFGIAELVEFITKFMVLKKGDLLFTGTPEGVGAVKQGDHLTAFLEGREMLNFRVK